MSFDVNPLNNSTPHQIKTAKSQDGGAGNTGYFQQGNKKKEDDENSMNKSLFKKEEDTFSLKDAKEVMYVEPPFLLKVVEYFKHLFKNLLHR